MASGVRCQDDVQHSGGAGGGAAARATRLPRNLRPPGAAESAALVTDTPTHGL